MAIEPSNPAQFVRIEAAALSELANRLALDHAAFTRSVELFQECVDQGHRIILAGMGKSGLVARKVAATLCSTGTPAHFLSPAEAVHGDLGLVQPGDIFVALSYSGETSEVVDLLPSLRRIGVSIVGITGCLGSTLAQASDVVLDVGVSIEACPLNLAPTASTTVMMALGDALALELSRLRGFDPQGFADLHPGGAIGRRLARVRDLMHSGAALPGVLATTPMPQVIYEMSRKKLGMTAVLSDAGILLGVISDGDLRRLLEREGSSGLDKNAGEVMNSSPVTMNAEAFASDALTLMEQRKITALVVVREEDRHVEGVIHLHDVLNALEPRR